MRKRHHRHNFGVTGCGTQHRTMDRLQKFGYVKRLEHDRVSLGDLCFGQTLRVGSDQHDRAIARSGIAAQLGKYVTTGSLRQQHIEQNHYRSILGCLAQGAEAIGRRVDVKALFREQLSHRGHHKRIVIDD